MSIVAGIMSDNDGHNTSAWLFYVIVKQCSLVMLSANISADWLYPTMDMYRHVVVAAVAVQRLLLLLYVASLTYKHIIL